MYLNKSNFFQFQDLQGAKERQVQKGYPEILASPVPQGKPVLRENLALLALLGHPVPKEKLVLMVFKGIQERRVLLAKMELPVLLDKRVVKEFQVFLGIKESVEQMELKEKRVLLVSAWVREACSCTVNALIPKSANWHIIP